MTLIIEDILFETYPCRHRNISAMRDCRTGNIHRIYTSAEAWRSMHYKMGKRYARSWLENKVIQIYYHKRAEPYVREITQVLENTITNLSLNFKLGYVNELDDARKLRAHKTAIRTNPLVLMGYELLCPAFAGEGSSKRGVITLEPQRERDKKLSLASIVMQELGHMLGASHHDEIYVVGYSTPGYDIHAFDSNKNGIVFPVDCEEDKCAMEWQVKTAIVFCEKCKDAVNYFLKGAEEAFAATKTK